jgi:hypothetical protein
MLYNNIAGTPNIFWQKVVLKPYEIISHNIDHPICLVGEKKHVHTNTQYDNF